MPSLPRPQKSPSARPSGSQKPIDWPSASVFDIRERLDLRLGVERRRRLRRDGRDVRRGKSSLRRQTAGSNCSGCPSVHP